jgi:hypothetical protein
MSAAAVIANSSSPACITLPTPTILTPVLEAPRLMDFSYSMLDLNAAMRNKAVRERALADAAVLQERSLAEAATLEANKLELLEAAEKEAEHARHVAESAIREAEEEAQRQIEEAQRLTEESQREVEEARRRVEEEVEKSRQAAAEAMEHPEEVELAALPDRIAEARFYEVDAEKIAEAERIYKKRAVAAFHLENAQERLLRAVAQGRADKGTLLHSGTVVRRVVALPLPTLTVITTHTVPLPLKEGKALSEEEQSTDLEDEDKSTAASDETSEA